MRAQQGNPLHAPIVKEGSNYQIETTLIFNQGPFHPNQNRSAFFCVTTNGLLKMFWTQNNGKVEETPHELESVTSADELVTHAAICSDPRCKPAPGPGPGPGPAPALTDPRLQGSVCLWLWPRLPNSCRSCSFR